MAAEGAMDEPSHVAASTGGQIANLRRRVTELSLSWPGLTSVLLGLVAACGYPPLHAWWIALPALALFIAHCRQSPTWRQAAWRGWTFGWAHLTLANNWIAKAFTYQGEMPEVLGWVAVPLLCIYLAFYPMLAATIAHLGARKTGPLAYGAVFAAAWIVTEWLRSWVFTGYPWPPLGLMLLGGWDKPGIAVLLPWLGTYALSGLVLLLAALLLISATLKKRWYTPFVVFAGLLISPMMLPVGQGEDGAVRYTLVQPLIPQDEINDGTKFEEQFQRTANLTLSDSDRPRVIFWPESAIPDYLEEGYPQRYYRQTTFAADPVIARQRIGSLIGEQSTLLTGVVNLDIGTRPDGIEGALSARNSVIALNSQGETTHHYAKAHLVPYGEYLPLEDWLSAIGLSRLTAGTIPYQPGPGPETFDLGELGKIGVQICYEIVFSGQVVDRVNRPDYLFNPSNDGWFGSWGPPQHLAQARMRALEEGLPVLRSTTTGISAVIDAEGIVRKYIPSGVSGKVEGMIPVAKPPTLFAQYGNALPLFWAILVGLLGVTVPRLLAMREPQS
ncbi:MAG: apolipoprotein N-acyltransferase [Pseudomonadota bacterium]